MVNKKIKLSDVTTTVEKVQKHELLGDFTFINGFPNEQKSEVLESVALRNHIKKVSPKSTIRFFVFTPLPGTELLEECLPLGYEKPNRIEDWKSYEYHSFKAPWLSEEYQKFVNTISWASLFADLDPKANEDKPLLQIIFKILGEDAELRFKHNFFEIAPEFEIINRFYRKFSE